ncbi:hypothetical protein S40285_04899 [Stachybotrys chlorohalonatus IBT 40285]|uniref:DNA ligase D 3'-phosphoesterase domain-containing protein n=1 Tax=Stachybotrys chlorohalonatus (strain IBT 40285) TaxID=1283841 RepID=A0A084QP69_STAC4|nr:hypothetical protein S40285_04899 [Stachybotrys chlorohalonata IBT 40285]
MASKRPGSPRLIANPFLKKRNLGWTLEPPSSVDSSSSSNHHHPHNNQAKSEVTPSASSTARKYSSSGDNITTAAIEAGDAHIPDHLAHFTTHLSSHLRPPALLPVSSYASLYQFNAGSASGAHFVIHQHDHPVAGTHYDLRLQINETSSVSWAIMYGLPGDPNSTRLTRNATETRIHCLWSLLHAAFQNRKIRLQLHGAKLPDPYIINLRLTKSDDAAGRANNTRPLRSRRRRRRRLGRTSAPRPEASSGEGEGDDEDDAHLVPSQAQANTHAEPLSAMEREIRELEDEQVRLSNAYAGADNTIGSVYQRRWFLSLDRRACGFVERRANGRVVWRHNVEAATAGPTAPSARRSTGPEDPGTQDAKHDRLSYPFHIHGVNHERSVVTGRTGADILRDEGVPNFIPRKGWLPVLK